MGNQKTVAGRQDATLSSVAGTKHSAKLPPLLAPLTRVITLEMIWYLLCHIVCLFTLIFGAGDELFTSRKRWFALGWTKQPQRREYSAGGVYEMFATKATIENKPMLPPHRLNSDLVLSLLFVLTYNGFFLALSRSVSRLIAEGDKRREFREGTFDIKSGTDDKVSKGKGVPFRLINCREIIYKVTLGATLVFCVLITTCVILQPPSEVQGAAPSLVLLSSVVPIYYGDRPNGARALERFYSAYQSVIITVLVGLVLDANFLAKA
ncbi:uncharacterized protein TEOVI_000205800 [Trypanosoma equiperdum]|uniref:Uncharacterized protein n=1 Tax=Trypanosoma equiperdum TaxID=5694 RepID=A0A1G4IEF2_TRYEQ|nr:hypothetical protein, conserved [Trypanosoma equiperdum]